MGSRDNACAGATRGHQKRNFVKIGSNRGGARGPRANDNVVWRRQTNGGEKNFLRESGRRTK